MPELPSPRVPHCRDLKDDAQEVQADVEGIDAPRFIPEWMTLGKPDMGLRQT